MTSLTAQKAHETFPEALDQVSRKDERIVIERDGEPLAALIPYADLKWLEELEERLDNEAADAALAEMKATGGSPVPFEQICKEMGI